MPLFLYETIPPLVTTRYTIWAKVVVIVPTYPRVLTLAYNLMITGVV